MPLGDAANRWIFPELFEEGYQPWAGCRWVGCASSSDEGVRSLEAHPSCIDRLGIGFDPRSFLEGAARCAGAPLGVELAVTFEVVRL